MVTPRAAAPPVSRATPKTTASVSPVIGAAHSCPENVRRLGNPKSMSFSSPPLSVSSRDGESSNKLSSRGERMLAAYFPGGTASIE